MEEVLKLLKQHKSVMETTENIDIEGLNKVVKSLGGKLEINRCMNGSFVEHYLNVLVMENIIERNR
jgi:hypothetical protein